MTDGDDVVAVHLPLVSEPDEDDVEGGRGGGGQDGELYQTRRRHQTTAIWLCAGANLINSADRVVFPVLLPQLAAAHSIGLRAQGWLHAAFPAGYISSLVLGSWLAQRTDAQPRGLLLAVVALWSTATVFTPLVASHCWLLLLTRFALGLGEGLGVPALYRVLCSSVSPDRRTTAVGWLTAAASVGQCMAGLLAPHLHWTLSFWALGAAGFYWCVAWMRSAGSFLPASGAEKTVESPRASWPPFVWSAPLLAIYAAHFAMNWTSYALAHWLPTYLHARFRVGAHQLGWAVAAPYAANSAAALGAAWLADRAIEKRRYSTRLVRVTATSVFGLLAAAVALLLFAAANTVFWAICLATCVMTLLACNAAGHLANHVDVAPRHATLTFAISNAIATIPGLLVGPATAELVAEAQGRWWPAFVIAAALNALGAVIYANFATTRQLY